MKTKTLAAAVLFGLAAIQGTAHAANYVLEIKGATDYLTIADSDSLDLVSTYTLEAWISPATTLPPEQGVISKPRHETGTGVVLRFAGKGPALAVNNGKVNFVFGGGDSIEANTWHHIAVTSDGTIGRAYIDGVEQASFVFSDKLLNSDMPLIIGQEGYVG
ncbi:MAG: LamG domain-containing protein, partial [Verrucomicrobia bacterium]|nr:LamG domain-containing protein [Verrucomicrobiota bacterium]